MAQTEENPLLRRPLYVFDLPPELLETLTPKTQQAVPIKEPDTNAASTTTTRPSTPGEGSLTPDGPASATSCNLCGMTFPSLQEQRDHVRSDLHGYNLKQKMKGLKPVGEAEFDKLVGDLDESISGSESEESDEDEDELGGTKGKDTTLSALLKRQARIAEAESEAFEGQKRKRGAGKPPLFWFQSDLLPKEISLGVYRAIFTDAEQEEEDHIVDTLKRKQLAVSVPEKKPDVQDGGVALPNPEPQGPHYFLCMVGGGHFAAMVVSLAPKVGKKHTGAEERQATVIAHKTFHRYTTRRKQGGSQSANDAAKGAAHSAGSSLRRYNEAALTNDIRNLLKEWKDMIDTAELLFIRATGSTNRRTLFGPYEGQVLRQNDPRNRGFPFSTRRATQAELMRCFVELTRVKISRIDEQALQASTATSTTTEATSNKATSSPKPSNKPPKPSKEEEALTLHSTQLVALAKRSKIPGLLSYLSSNNLSPNFVLHPPSQYHHTPTLLHLAASLNNPHLVLALLTKAGADPGFRDPGDEDQRLPFSLAGDRATRDAFRIARAQIGEDAWAWEAAGVPPALSKAEVERREARERAEREAEAQAEQERRRAETERLREETRAREEAQRQRRAGKGKTLGGAVVPEKTAADRREEEVRGLTPEMRMRLERERRARAAEERIRRMQQGGGR